MGYASHLVARVAVETLSEPRFLLARSALGIYATQLGVNLLWPSLFFGIRNPKAGLLDIGVLGGLAFGMTWMFGEVDTTAGLLCLPYLAWVGFAAFLNYEIVDMNPNEGGESAK